MKEEEGGKGDRDGGKGKEEWKGRWDRERSEGRGSHMFHRCMNSIQSMLE